MLFGRIGESTGDTAGEEIIRTSVEVWTNAIAQEERYTATTLLVEYDLQRLCDGILPRVVIPCQKDHKALLGARGIAFAQSFHHSSGKLHDETTA